MLGEVAENPNAERKRRRVGKSEDVEVALLKWFTDARERNVNITTAVLEEKANQLGKELGLENFKSTNGWLCRWKTRNNIKYKKIHGEKQDADPHAADTWTSTVLPNILEAYAPCDVYNADETGIYFRALPDGTLTFSNDKRGGCNKSKERITALVAANMDGTDKRPLFVIGKSKKPRCFSGIKNLPLPYAKNSNSWMTGATFRSWLIKFNEDMKQKHRKMFSS